MKTKIYIAKLLLIVFSNSSFSQFWQPVGTGVNGRVNSFTFYNGELVIGGAFNEAGGVPVDRVATWNGSNWSDLGVTGIIEVSSLAVSNNELFAGVPSTATPVLKWDGSNWINIGNTSYGVVYTLTEHNTQLVGAINFSVNGYELMSWNGTNWNIIGSGGEFINGSTRSLLSVTNDLYMAGNFQMPSLNTVGIAKWDGSNWSALGSGIDWINTLAEYNGEIYAGGSFTTVLGAPSNYIAKWDGTNWSSVGSGVNNTVYALKVINNELYAGGSFNTAGGITAEGVAKWNGTNWTPVGGGVNGIVSAIAEFNNELYIGGDMAISGGGPTYFNYLGKMSLGVNVEEFNKEIITQIYPNPSTGEITIATTEIPHEINVTDLTGKIILQKSGFDKAENKLQLKKRGFYLVKIKTDNNVQTGKITLLK